MTEIRIGPRAQLALLLLIGLLIVAAIVGQLPEAKRYFKIETM